MTPAQIIKGAIPEADDGLCDHILWGCTAYPFVKLTAKDLYRAASRFRRAQDHGKRLCDFCDHLAVEGCWECERCASALGRPPAKIKQTEDAALA